MCLVSFQEKCIYIMNLINPASNTQFASSLTVDAPRNNSFPLDLKISFPV